MAKGSINKVILIGTLGRDPEMRYMPNGNAVVNFSIATNEGYNDRNSGQWVEKTEWHRITAYARLAEIVGEFLKKGSKVYIEGKLQTREWEKDGVKRYTTEIVANEMTMLDGRNNNQDGGYSAQQPANSGAATNTAAQQSAQPISRPQAQGGYGAPQQPAQTQGGYAQPAQNAPAQSGYGQQAAPPQPAPAHQPQQAPAHQPQQAPAHQPQQAPAHQPQQAPAQQPQPSNAFDDFDDDIPF